MRKNRTNGLRQSGTGDRERGVQPLRSVRGISDGGGSKGRILVLDGDPVVRNTVAHMLSSLGYASYAAETEEEAAECYHRASSCGYPFQAVIRDLHASQAPGEREGAMRLPVDDRQPGTMTITMSSADSYLTARECWRRGIRVALWKPFTLHELEQALALCAEPTGGRASLPPALSKQRLR